MRAPVGQAPSRSPARALHTTALAPIPQSLMVLGGRRHDAPGGAATAVHRPTNHDSKRDAVGRTGRRPSKSVIAHRCRIGEVGIALCTQARRSAQRGERSCARSDHVWAPNKVECPLQGTDVSPLDACEETQSAPLHLVGIGRGKCDDRGIDAPLTARRRGACGTISVAEMESRLYFCDNCTCRVRVAGTSRDTMATTVRTMR